MADDWFADVRKYDPNADEATVKKIVSYLGIALRNRDSSLVSFGDPAEVDRVRERYLRKKLGLTDPDETLDAGLNAVRDQMAGDRTKNRVTVYYLLADWFGKLDLFGGPTGTAGGFSSAGGAAALGGGAAAAAGLAAASADEPRPALRAVSPEDMPASIPTDRESPPVAPMAAATPAPERAAYDSGPDRRDGDVGGGIPSWLKWLLLLAALVLLFFLVRSCMHRDDAAAPASTAATDSTGSSANAAGADLNASSADANAMTTAAPVPQGAGVVASQAAGKPMLTVYFDSGKADVSNQLAAQAATLKSYLDANPGSVLQVSGYNDPSGNAALNAALSKKRAQGVAAALAAAGIPEESVKLVKPAETTTATVTPEQARRVEVTIG